jgi:ATP-dependent Clp protease protease subunit
MLSEVKESIINAYELKTGLSRTQLSHLMDAETWMNARKAIELGFADTVLTNDANTPMHDAASMGSYSFSRRQVTNALLNKAIAKKSRTKTEPHISVASLQQRLSLLIH